MTHINDRIRTVFDLLQQASEVCSLCKPAGAPEDTLARLQAERIEALEAAIAACRKAMNGDDDG